MFDAAVLAGVFIKHLCFN